MTRFELRYDLRNPHWAGVSTTDRYRAALEQIEWADQHGFRTVTLSEHHGTDDGYLPSPLVFAAAVAARTTRIRLRIAALIAPLHDPLRLAEDLAVLDQISGGRLEVVIAAGYVGSEFAMFERSLADRVPAVVETIETLRSAWTGEPFEFRGRTVTVTPTPCREPRPPIYLGGSSEGAARRAARIADLFMPSEPAHWEWYRQAVLERDGVDYGPMPALAPRFVHVDPDTERGWKQVERFVEHERASYSAWAAAAGQVATGYRPVSEALGLRDDPDYVVVTPDECVQMLSDLGPGATAALHPMMGGVPPEVAWASLRRIVDEVMPRL